jgi:hypothetical protein
MLIKAATLNGYKLDSLDGEIGQVDEFYFDDQHWVMRYLVVNTGNWLTGRLVLISPYALKSIDSKAQHIGIDLNKLQIEESPPLNSDKPVSRQFEEAYYGYYGWPMYWAGPFMWGYSPYIERDRQYWIACSEEKNGWDPHLRSTDDVSGYHLRATDGDIGHVEDFIIDDETWAIRYLVIATQNWWPGKKVLVSPRWIERISWDDSTVFINLPRETIRQSPEYTEDSILDRDYELRLHQHYERPAYWDDVLADKLDSGQKKP